MFCLGKRIHVSIQDRGLNGPVISSDISLSEKPALERSDGRPATRCSQPGGFRGNKRPLLRHERPHPPRARPSVSTTALRSAKGRLKGRLRLRRGDRLGFLGPQPEPSSEMETREESMRSTKKPAIDLKTLRSWRTFNGRKSGVRRSKTPQSGSDLAAVGRRDGRRRDRRVRVSSRGMGRDFGRGQSTGMH